MKKKTNKQTIPKLTNKTLYYDKKKKRKRNKKKLK